ncbi:simple sugar transport system permease protein [Keratinibaculum paraultunense]|uniref:Simple sugar transport system permease protein n=1 Tax=Keratinibaculum paraultunense TaxID=1278232 RepID=A0A4R3KX75_9FIRM|nr:ABC transporter permease [Keratinibaculum paraultunense]QQY79296.1 ABC transporter permease [Keratinibaculum paraultunense]TCS89430.1 simple sugar transport system permease protein [Keratinibaculum paraultunense]
MKRYKEYYVPIFFLILSVLGIIASKASLNFILGELYDRFVRNEIFLLALIFPIMSGMGINFSITIGAMAAQMSMLFVIDIGFTPKLGFIIVILLSTVLSIVFGNIIGNLLNKAKGKEMIASMVIGFLGTSLYQIIFMVAYGTIIKPFNKDILLTRGIGVKSMLDIGEFKDLFNNILSIKIGDVKESLVPVIIIIIMGIIVHLITKSKIGYRMNAVGEDMYLAEKVGIDVDKTRKIAIIISTILASLAQIMFIQNLGILNVYTGHLNLDIFASAALLAGGATFKKANIKNAFIGIFLFHTLFIVSPLVGQNIFKNPALGEYFRSFIAYGTIVFALMINLKNVERNT